MGKQINKSLSVAFDILKNGKENLEFLKLWNLVAKKMDIKANDPNIIAEFYTSLLLDKRFVMVNNNIWSLRRNFKFSDIVVEIESVYDIEDPEIDTDTIEESITSEEFVNNNSDDALVKEDEDSSMTVEIEPFSETDDADDEIDFNKDDKEFEEVIIP